MTRTPPTVVIADRVLDRPAGPPINAQSDHATQLRFAEHAALRDVKTLDPATVQFLDGALLPYEWELDARIEREQNDATARLRDAESTGRALQETAQVSLEVTDRGKRVLTTLAEQRAKLAEADAAVQAALQERRRLAEIAEGRAPDQEGVTWYGHAPSEPDPDTTHARVRWSAANIRAKLLAWLPYVVLVPVELYIGTVILHDYLRLTESLGDWAWAGALALAFVLGLTVMPSLTGQLLAKVYHRGFILGKEVVSLVWQGLLWVGSIAGMVVMRVIVDQSSAVQAARSDSGQATTADSAYNLGLGVLIWAIAIAIIGGIVLVLKVVYHNPAISKVIAADHNLVSLWADRFRHLSIIEQGTALVAARVQAAADVVELWRHHRDDVLPRQREECRATYFAWLIDKGNHSGVTAAVYGLLEARRNAGNTKAA